MKKKKWLLITAVIIVIIISLLLGVKLTGYFVTSIDSCQDSDFGNDYWKKGFVQGQFHNIEKNLQPEYYFEEDSCKNNKVLTEYFCEKQGIHSYKQTEQYNCPQGCSEGKCSGPALETPKISIWQKIARFFGM